MLNNTPKQAIRLQCVHGMFLFVFYYTSILFLPCIISVFFCLFNDYHNLYVGTLKKPFLKVLFQSLYINHLRLI